MVSKFSRDTLNQRKNRFVLELSNSYRRRCRRYQMPIQDTSVEYWTLQEWSCTNRKRLQNTEISNVRQGLKPSDIQLILSNPKQTSKRKIMIFVFKKRITLPAFESTLISHMSFTEFLRHHQFLTYLQWTRPFGYQICFLWNNWNRIPRI